MDPKALGKGFEQKHGARMARAEQERAKAAAEDAKQKEKLNQLRAAISDTVIPYLKEVEAEFPKGQFSIEVAKSKGVIRSPTGVSFSVGGGPKYTIELDGQRISVWHQGPSGTGLNVHLVHGFYDDPAAITRGVIGKLVQSAIDAE
jgi:hypothetical protein